MGGICVFGSAYFFCPYVDVCVDVPVRSPCSCLVRSVGSAFALLSTDEESGSDHMQQQEHAAAAAQVESNHINLSSISSKHTTTTS